MPGIQGIPRATPRRVAYSTLAIMTGYAVARFFVYRAMPAGDADAWLRRDFVMSALRVAGLLLCLRLCKRHGGWKQWGWGFSTALGGGTVLALTTAMELLHRCSYGSQTSYSRLQILLGWLSTGPVAFFEEAACRSLLFLSMRQAVPPWKAALFSSAIFTLYHIQSQSPRDWPHIFAFGLGACAALDGGVGLGWLIAAHWLVDGVWLHLSAGAGAPWAWLGFKIALAVVIFASMILLLRRDVPTRDSVVPGS